MHEDRPDHAETTSRWRPLRSPAGPVALGSGLAIAACAAFAWAYLLGQPIGGGSILALIIGASGSLLAAAMLLVALAYYSMSYDLDGDQLTISSLWIKEFVPLARIDAMLSGKKLGRRVKVDGINWRGIRLGKIVGSDLANPTVFGTTRDPNAAVIVTTESRSYVLTPAALEGFKGQLVGRLEALSEDAAAAAPEPASRGTLIPSREFLHDRIFAGLIAAAGVVLLISSTYVALKIPGLPATVPLHIGAAGQPDFTVPRLDLFRLPLMGLLVLGVNSLAAVLVYEWQRDAGRLMAAATVAIEVVGLLALLRLVH